MQETTIHKTTTPPDRVAQRFLDVVDLHCVRKETKITFTALCNAAGVYDRAIHLADQGRTITSRIMSAIERCIKERESALLAASKPEAA